MNKYIKLEEILDSENIKYNESMKKHTTVRIGGKCDVLVTPTSMEEIKRVVEFFNSENIEYHVIGNGSNLLVTDEDIHCAIIKIGNKFSNVEVDGKNLIALSGASMPRVSLIAKQNLLSGMEFACGIPGTIGGGIFMNAGAYGDEMSNIVDEITYFDENLNVCKILGKEAQFSYRKSIFSFNPKYVILKCNLKLRKGNEKEIELKMKENSEARKQKQPLEFPNFGSVFKRPEGYFVGKLIEEAGLRGKTIGGAQVSTKHTGFIVNIGNATCKDILDLIKYIQDTVYNKFGVKLETEVEIIK